MVSRQGEPGDNRQVRRRKRVYQLFPVTQYTLCLLQHKSPVPMQNMADGEKQAARFLQPFIQFQ